MLYIKSNLIKPAAFAKVITIQQTRSNRNMVAVLLFRDEYEYELLNMVREYEVWSSIKIEIILSYEGNEHIQQNPNISFK